jgi:antitoxin component of MazEF toxin-antitoxin module
MVRRKRGHFRVRGSSGVLTIPADIIQDDAFPLPDGYKVMVEIQSGSILVSPLPRFEHINTYESHATIYDNKEGREIEVYFYHNGVWCDSCKAPNCEHIRYALTLPEVVGAYEKSGLKLPKIDW